MVKNYKVITLCGSTRFKDEFMKAQKELTLKYILFSFSSNHLINYILFV